MKRLTITILMFALGISLFAQKAKVMRLEQADHKLIHFGFTLGMHTQEFAVTPSLIPDENGVTWHGDVGNVIPGFTVGIISDLRLSNYFNLRFVPTLNFGDREITYSGMQNGVKIDEYKTNVLSSLISFPFYIKYRAKRVNNYRPYLIAGGGGMTDLSRKKDLPILLKTLDYFIEFGVGCDFYLEYFKLAPEFKFCLGFNDMLERERPQIANIEDLRYTDAISKLTSRLFVLTFNFE